MENFKQKKKNPPMEVTDDVLEQVSGGTDNYAEIIPEWTVTGNVVAPDDDPETMIPVGAITEA